MSLHVGIEIEYLIMTNDGKPVMSGYNEQNVVKKGAKIMQKAAGIIDPRYKTNWDGVHVIYEFTKPPVALARLMPDTFTLLETVTHHSDNLDYLRDQLWKMKEGLIKAATSSEFNCQVSGAACPVAYAFNTINHPRCSYNTAGMHVHITAPDDREKIKLSNLILQIIPELTALSANSPVYDSKLAENVSHRLKSCSIVSADMVEPFTYDPDNPLDFNDPNKRYRFVTVFAKAKKTVEVRGFDCPMTIDWAMGLAALLHALASKSTKLFIEKSANTIVSGKKEYRQYNYKAAYKKGLNATFKIDPTFHRKINNKDVPLPFLYHDPDTTEGTTIPAHLAVKRLLYYIEDEAYQLGYLPFLKPFYEAIKKRENQADQQIKMFKSSGNNINTFMNKLTQKAATPPQNARDKTRTGKPINYLTARQRSRNSKDTCLELSAGGIKRLSVRPGSVLIVSGPLGSVSLSIVKDSRASSSTGALNEFEIGLGKTVRKKLGISLYDPVIVDTKELKPFVIKNSGEEWYNIAVNQPLIVKCMVEKGLLQYGKGHATIAPSTAHKLGLSDGKTVLVSKDSDRPVKFVTRISPNLRKGVVLLMEADRKSIGVHLKDTVTLSCTITKGIELIVRQGLNDDPDTPVTVRLSATLLSVLSIKDGEQVSVTSAKGNEVNAIAYASTRYNQNTIGMRLQCRQKLGVKTGETVKVKKYSL